MHGETWFRPKAYGYGATPKNWKGWLATIIYAAALFGLMWAMVRAGPDNVAATVTCVIAMIAITAGFVGVSKLKTDDEWRWRWGN